MSNIKLGTKIDKLYKLKQEIGEAKKVLEKSTPYKKLVRLNERFKEQEEELMNTIPTQELDGGIGKLAKAKINRTTVGTVDDWNQLYKFIKRTNGFDLLNRAFNNKAYRERLEAGKKVPGVKKMTVKKLSLTKVPGGKS